MTRDTDKFRRAVRRYARANMLSMCAFISKRADRDARYARRKCIEGLRWERVGSMSHAIRTQVHDPRLP
jgi:hypothetical protein